MDRLSAAGEALLSDPASARELEPKLRAGFEVLNAKLGDQLEASVQMSPEAKEALSEVAADMRSSVLVLASKFLATWLPRLPAGRDIVLAVCNPHRARLAPLAERALWLPDGDVTAWLAEAGKGYPGRSGASE